MTDQLIEKEYYAIDTFSGFTRDDADFERNFRGKTKLPYRGFSINDKRWFDAGMELHNIHRVHSIQADVTCYDLTLLGGISFALLDVDLYRPTKKCLVEVYRMLTPGGIIVVDDCDPNENQFDGAAQAYAEFMQTIKKPNKIIHNKLGIIEK
jgi:hypothetical protein